MCNFNLFSGKNFEKVCEMCQITLNKSAIFGDNGAISPGGVRIGMQFIVSYSTDRKCIRILGLICNIFRYTCYDFKRMLGD